MNERTSNLLAARPVLANAKVFRDMSAEERFQNMTLRPIIKLQNDLLLHVFHNYIRKRKNVFYGLSLDERMDYILQGIQKDIKLRNSLKGMILGQFTIEEYIAYTQNSSALNKRMMQMVIKRLQDQIQFFDTKMAI